MSKPPGYYGPNEEKKLEITISPAIVSAKAGIQDSQASQVFHRYPIRTQVFAVGDPVAEKIVSTLLDLQSSNPELFTKPWSLVVSEKIVAIAQGRSYLLSDIHPSIFAHILQRFVRRTPHGIGLGSPYTMQLAIQEVGLLRMIVAALASVITKPLGLRGVFYRIAGHGVNAIDGPTEYSLYPSNVSAKLPPKDPQRVTKEISSEISRHPELVEGSRFMGTVIIDANDLGRNVLGNDSQQRSEVIEQIFADNPMGQSDEQTPLTIVSAV